MPTFQKRIGIDGSVSYRVQVRLRGYPSESATFERLSDAKQWAAQTESDMKAGRYFGESKRHTFDELCKEYAKHITGQVSSQEKIAQLDRWRELLKDCLLSEITAPKINKAREVLLSEDVRPATRKTGNPEADAARPMIKRSGATVNRYVAALSSCLTFAVKKLEWLERNPCERAIKAKESAGRVRFLSDDEIKRLLDACRSHADLYLAVILSVTTGGRNAEIMTLRWHQIDFSRQTIALEKTKNGERRTIPLVGEAFTLLQERAKVRSLKDERIFIPVKEGTETRNLREAWRRALEDAGITDFRWHDLRHTAASYLVMSGVSLTEVAKILGHKTLQMVSRYAHLSDEHIVTTGQKLANRLGLG